MLMSASTVTAVRPGSVAPGAVPARRVRLAYLVSHPIQYQAPLLRRIAQEPDIALSVLFGSDLSVQSYHDEGFGVKLTWDTPLLEGYRSTFLPALRDDRTISATSPISRGVYRHLRGGGGEPAFDALWVHGYASVNALQGIAAAGAFGIPVLLRAESWLADRERGPAKLVAKSAFFSLLSRTVTAVLPIGIHNAAYWRHYLPGVPQFPVPYAVDNAAFAARARAAQPRVPALRRELGLDHDAPVILFASKLQARKHADHLVDAYQQLLSRWDQARPAPCLVIVGDGEERKRLEEHCTGAGLSRVRFAGFRNQSELPGFFAMAQVFVLPSRAEPWGLIVNEAMACGCPAIVSSDVGCHPDLITDGIDGFVYPVGDVGALAAALYRVFAQPEQTRAIGAAAADRVARCSFDADVRGLRAALAFSTRKLRL